MPSLGQPEKMLDLILSIYEIGWLDRSIEDEGVEIVDFCTVSQYEIVWL